MMKSKKYFYGGSGPGVILLPGIIYGPFGDEHIKLVFDPGAYRSIIDTSLTDALGYQANSNSKRVSTVSVVGKEQGYTINLEKIKILNFEFENQEIVCMDLPEKYQINGLLGLDILEKFEIILRHREKWIEFKLLSLSWANPKIFNKNNKLKNIFFNKTL